MGFFKKIVKGVKSFFKGVKKVFKKVVGAIGKALNSKWGKAIMLIAGIVTMGTALAAGQAAYSAAATAGESFLTSLSAGASGFVNSLTGGLVGGSNQYVQAAQQTATTASQTAKVADAATQTQNVATQAGEAGGLLENTANAQKAITDVATQSGGAAGGAGGAAGGAAGVDWGAASKAYEQLGSVANTSQNTGGNGFLSKAAETAKKFGKGTADFAKSEGGGNLLGKVVQGYAEGRALEEQAKEELRQRRRLDKSWDDYDWGNDAFRIDLGPGWRQRAQRTTQDLMRDTRIDPNSALRADVAAGYN